MLLYFVKMVAVFALMVVESLLFFFFAKELPAEDCPTLTFHFGDPSCAFGAPLL